MELYLNLQEQYQKDPTLVHHSRLVNEAAVNHKIFQNQKIQNISTYVKEVNSLLNNNKKKWNGIHQLLILLPQCSSDILLVNGEKWLRLCSLFVTSKASTSMKQETCEIISLLTEYMYDLPELQRNITSRHASNLLPYLASADQQWSDAALQCIYDYTLVFPNHLSTFKNDLERDMLTRLDTPLGTTSANVSLAGRVYAVVPSPPVGSGGKAAARGFKMSQLMALAHIFCDQLFENVMEKQTYNTQEECKISLVALNLSPEVHQDPIKHMIMNITRLANTFTFIYEQFAVGSSDNCYITFKPADLIAQLLRVLQVEIHPVMQQKGQEHMILALLLPSLHIRALRLLHQLLLRPVIAYSFDEYWNIIKAQMLTTLITSKQGLAKKSNTDLTNRGELIRTLAYDVLNTLTKVSSGRVTITVELVSCIIQDLTPDQNLITLQNSRGSKLASVNIQGSKKKKKKSSGTGKVNSQDLTSNTDKYCSFHCSSLAISSLQLAESICKYCVHSPPSAMQDLQRGLVKLMEIIFLHASRIEDNIAYSEGTVRAKLINTVVAMCMQPHFICIPPYIYILHMLQSAMADPSKEVIEACQNGICTISFIMSNPSINTLNMSFTTLNTTEEKMIDQEVVNNNSETVTSDVEDNDPQKKGSEVNEDCNSSDNDSDDISQGDEEKQVNTPDEQQSTILHLKPEESNNQEKVPSEASSDSEVVTDDDEIVNQTSPNKDKKRPFVEPQNSTKKRKCSPKKSGGPSLDEMLASFVDADPDSD